MRIRAASEVRDVLMAIVALLTIIVIIDLVVTFREFL